MCAENRGLERNATAAQIAVLKCGGSVLVDEEALVDVAREVRRWRDGGFAVVVVVSALEGETDRLLSHAKAHYGSSPDPAALAAYVATGELTAAALLGLALGRSGIAAEVLDSAAIRLRTEGPPLDGRAVSVDAAALRAAVARAGVVVVPGFIGRDEHERTTLLGRGGSDLTALFLASSIGAQRCRLIKDVDGLYERDPAESDGPPPKRFSLLSWSDATRLGGQILQQKAAEFARQSRVPFEVGALGRADATLVRGDVTQIESDGEDARVGSTVLGGAA